jgi:hypothetical protein
LKLAKLILISQTYHHIEFALSIVQRLFHSDFSMQNPT